MCEIKACRICLRNESKFYHFDEYNLKKYYEEVTNKFINETDGLPQYFCYECAALLYKFHTFREKCEYGEKILKDMLWNGLLTYVGISTMNSEDLYRPKFLTLGASVANKRVITLQYHHIEDPLANSNIKPEIIDEEITGPTGEPFSDGDNFVCDDPKADPVSLNLSYDASVKMEIVENAVTLIDTESKFETVKIELEQIEKHPNVKQEETETISVPQNAETTKQNVEEDCTREIHKSEKEAEQKRSIPQPIDLDNETDNIELSKIKSEKSASVKSSKIKTTSKLKKTKSKDKNFPSLNPEYWEIFNLSDEDALADFQKKALDKKYLNAPYKCELCYRGFSQKSMLDRHMPQRHDESVGRIVCHFCKLRFKNPCHLLKHQRLHYNKYKCLRCGQVCCMEESAVTHDEVHSGVKRKCPHCTMEFQHVSTYYTHLRTHRSKHVCSLCGESFVSHLGLLMHKKVKHKVGINVVDVEESKYCEICKITFESENAYKIHLDHSAMHVMEFNNLDAEIIDEEEKEQNKEDNTPVTGLLNRISGEAEKDLSAVRKCVNTRKDVTNRHGVLTWKTNAKISTTCKYCNTLFESMSACLRHHLAEHRGKRFPSKRIICEICGMLISVCSVRAHMDRHGRSPARDRTNTCDTCGRSFATKAILNTHQVTHTGEKNHACTLCDKRYTQSSSLSLHYNTIHLKQPYPKRNRQKTEKDEGNVK